jgi:hypothetical protein
MDIGDIRWDTTGEEMSCPSVSICSPKHGHPIQDINRSTSQLNLWAFSHLYAHSGVYHLYIICQCPNISPVQISSWLIYSLLAWHLNVYGVISRIKQIRPPQHHIQSSLLNVPPTQYLLNSASHSGLEPWNYPVSPLLTSACKSHMNALNFFFQICLWSMSLSCSIISHLNYCNFFPMGFLV